jgi:hypothetical protein
LGHTDSFGQELRVIVGEGIAEGLLGGIVKVLPIKEGEGALYDWFSGHWKVRRKKTPPEAQGLIQRGADTHEKSKESIE